MDRGVLIGLDTVGVQDYIFRTNELKQIVGASYLVDCATGQWLVDAISNLRHNVRDMNDAAQPFTGWGLLLHRDDIARIGRLLGERRPAIGGAPLFDATALDQALQRDPAHPGLEAIDASFRYAHGFWAHDVSPYIGCATPTWVPYMAGFGGITVLLLPNDTVYYYFSDGGKFRWSRAASEANRIRPYCAADRKANP